MIPTDIQKGTAYYAHSLRIYNSPREVAERAFIAKHFKKVVCPNRDMGELNSPLPYMLKVSKCTHVVCSEFESCVGSGVFHEVCYALANAIPVFALRRARSGSFYLKPVTGIKLLEKNRNINVQFARLKTK